MAALHLPINMPANSAHCKPIGSSQKTQIQGQLSYSHCERSNSGNMFTQGIQLLQLDIFHETL